MVGGLSDLGLMGSSVTLPFLDYSPVFQPEELEALAAAYDAVWQQLRVSRLTLTADELAVLKKIWRRSFWLLLATETWTQSN